MDILLMAKILMMQAKQFIIYWNVLTQELAVINVKY